MALRIEKEVDADPEAIRRLYSDLMVRHAPPEDELIRRTQRDHLGMEALVASMQDGEEPKARKETLLRFGQWLRDHIRWEEDVLFEETQARLNEEELKALGEQLDDQLSAVPVSPWGTDGPPFALTRCRPSSRGRGRGRCLRRAHQEQRHARVAQDLIGNAPHDPAGDAGAAVGSHRDQIRAFILRDAQYHLRGRAEGDDASHVQASLT